MYAGYPFCSRCAKRCCRPTRAFVNMSKARTSSTSSRKYRKSMQSTNCAGSISVTNFQTGTPRSLAHKSHTALTSAAVARWITPLSGPSQRSCEWFVTCRQNAPMLSTMSDRLRPTTNVANASIAAQHSSLPWPIVNVMPCPSRAESVCKIT